MRDDLTEREERIRKRAHQLWEEAGQPWGRDNEFWERASREIDAYDPEPPAEDK